MKALATPRSSPFAIRFQLGPSLGDSSHVAVSLRPPLGTCFPLFAESRPCSSLRLRPGEPRDLSGRTSDAFVYASGVPAHPGSGPSPEPHRAPRRGAFLFPILFARSKRMGPPEAPGVPDTPSIASVMREIAMQIPSECDIGRRPPAHVAEPIVASRYEIRHTAHLWPKVSRGSPWACCASSFGPSLIRRFHLRGYGGQVGGQAWIAIHPPKHCPAHASELSTLVSGLWTETGTGPGGTFRSTPPAWPDRNIQVPWRFRDLDLLHERESPSGTVLASQIMGM